MASTEPGPPGWTYPPLGATGTIYAVGDIHGRADLLDRVHATIEADRVPGPTTEIYLGDYVDRGPDSRGTLDRLIARGRSASIVALRGNHEEIMLKVLQGREGIERWRQVGGLETMLSYGVDVGAFMRGAAIDSAGLLHRLREAVPADHVSFLMATRPFEIVGGYLFVHAGLRPGRTLAEQSPRDLHWIRDEFLTSTQDFGHVVVHGHTPVTTIDCRPNRINIDTGAYLSGRLSCIRIDGHGPCMLHVE